MWPCVSIIICAKCAVGVCVGEWPKDVIFVVSHILYVLEL